jgi:hypothetical protein
MRTESDPVPEMFCSLEYRMMDEVQKPIIKKVKNAWSYTSTPSFILMAVIF